METTATVTAGTVTGGTVTGETGEATERTGAQAVERAISLLDCFSTGEPRLGLRQLAQRANLPTSTTYRLVQALVRGGLLERQGRDGYQVGRAMVAFARPALTRLRVDAAAPLLYRLAANIKLTVSFGVAGERDFVTVISARPTVPSGADQLPDQHEPFHATALGKTVLAFGPPGARAVGEDGDDLERFTPRTRTAPAELAADVASIRRLGYALTDEERTVGVRALAVPVFAADPDIAAGAMGVQAGTGRLTDQLVRDLVPALQYFSREVGQRLRSDPPR